MNDMLLLAAVIIFILGLLTHSVWLILFSIVMLLLWGW